MIREFTTETRLYINEEFTNYFDKYIEEYNHIARVVLHRYLDSNYFIKYPKKSNFVTSICNEFNVTKRTANSILLYIQGMVNSQKEILKTNIKNITAKINKLECDISSLKIKINKVKESLSKNEKVNNLDEYRNNKFILYKKQQRLNKLIQKVQKLNNRIKNREYYFALGGKRSFKSQYLLKENGYSSHEKWYKEYKKNRDTNILYVGSKDETLGNQMFQVSYNKEEDNFIAKIRKGSSLATDKYITTLPFKIKYQKDKILSVLNGDYPLTYRLRRIGKKYYLQIMFPYEVDSIKTSTDNGCVGLDYNNGFIELCEVNKTGNIVDLKRYDLIYHGLGNKALNEIRHIAKQITSICKSKGKDLIIENLNFNKKKANSTKNKKYNKMIHSFDYSRYTEVLENSCYRNEVRLTTINPAYTSRIGYSKYSRKRKLSIHQAASYVIARRGMKYIDK